MAELLLLSKEFCDEVGFTHDADNAYRTINSYASEETAGVIYCKDDNQVKSAALVLYEDAFQAERCGVLVKFYVRKPWRKTGAGRELMRKVCEWFDEKGCVFSDAMASGGMATDKITLNLYRKFGYTDGGLYLRRENNGRNHKFV